MGESQGRTLRRSRVRSDISMAPHLRTTTARWGRSSSPSKLSSVLIAPRKDGLSSKACAVQQSGCPCAYLPFAGQSGIGPFFTPLGY